MADQTNNDSLSSSTTDPTKKRKIDIATNYPQLETDSPHKRRNHQDPGQDISNVPKKIDDDKGKQKLEKKEDSAATGKPLKGVSDLEAYHAISNHKARHGLYPWASKSHMDEFLEPWLQEGFGDKEYWKLKLKIVKDKYKYTGDDEIDWGNEDQWMEYSLWLQIFGRDQ